jgi:glutathione synthase/RimK-type ligase-like ATP-grasp enzyme
MILLCGIPSEAPLALVRAQLDQGAMPYVWFNQRRFDDMEMGFRVSQGAVAGCLRVGASSYRLEHVTGVYIRLIDDRTLPELTAEPEDSPRRQRCRALHDTLLRWTEIAPARVVNRAGPMASNCSKPYHAQLIRRHGFRIPETLITNEPSRAREFYERHARIVYKSISGVRSIVRALDQRDLERLDRVRWCPIQFQAFVPGTNVRVHVVDAEVFATAIHTQAVDYRYAHHQHSEVELQAVRLPDELADRCVGLARALELAFAGIDLKITPDNEVYCFEVNPSPAFSYYESHTGQPIAAAVARHLAGR